jgi:ATP/maltotriose-dependent transcriptional regulator MalT
VQAADEALAAWAPAEEAERHAERALEMWDRVTDAEERTGLDHVGLLELALAAAINVGHESRALSHAAEALAELDPQVNPRRAARVLAGRAEALRRMRRDAIPDLEAAVRLLGDEPTDELATVLSGLANARILEGDLTSARDVGERAVAVSRAVGASNIEAQALVSLGGARCYLGEFDEGVGSLSAALDLAIASGDHDTALRAYANLSDTLEFVGRHEEASEAATTGIELARRVGLIRRMGIFLCGNRAESLGRLGRFAEAMQLADEAVSLGADSSSAVSPQIVRAELAAAVGELDDARAFAAAARRALGDEPPHQYQAHLCYVEGEIARLAGNLPAARIAVDRGLADGAVLARYVWPLLWLALRVEADLATLMRDRHEPSPEGQVQRIAEFDRRGAQLETETPAARGYRVLTAAERARALGEPDAAVWEEAVAVWRASGEPHPLAYALLRLATNLADAGERERAAAAAGESLELSRRLSAEPLVAEAEALMRRARLPLAAEAGVAVEADPFGLTERELEVLRLVASGSSNAQIGAALFISPKTASVHVSNILGKLGVARRGEAAAVAHRLGLLA